MSYSSSTSRDSLSMAKSELRYTQAYLLPCGDSKGPSIQLKRHEVAIMGLECFLVAAYTGIGLDVKSELRFSSACALEAVEARRSMLKGVARR